MGSPKKVALAPTMEEERQSKYFKTSTGAASPSKSRNTSPSKIRKNTNAAPFPTGGRQRNPWTTEETEKLYKGIKRHGVGQWAAIKVDQSFTSRTGVQLKDRWRSMLKDNKIMSDLVAKFGAYDD